MRRRNKKSRVVNTKKTKLVTALETGKSIKGMQGFVNINKQCGEDETLFVPVTVEGLKASEEEEGGYCSCGELLVAGVILGSDSKLYFKVEDWVDTTEQVEANTAKKRAIAKAEQEAREIVNHHYLARRRLALQTYVIDNLKVNGDIKEFEANMREVNGDYNKLTDPQVKYYAKVAVCVANEIKPDEASYELKLRD